MMATAVNAELNSQSRAFLLSTALRADLRVHTPLFVLPLQPASRRSIRQLDDFKWRIADAEIVRLFAG
jgi:hypothetical protein